MAEATGVFFYVYVLSANHYKVKKLRFYQLPWHSSYHFLLHQCRPAQSHSLRQYLSDWLGLCYWNRFCYHHLRLHIGWPLQSSHHDLLRCLAGLSLEKSSPLYILSDLWGIHGRNVAYGHVLVRILERCFPIWFQKLRRKNICGSNKLILLLRSGL